MTLKQSICPLCSSIGYEFYTKNSVVYFRCNHCEGIFIADENRPSPESELCHYQTHLNDVNDSRYQLFVSPIINSILRDFGESSLGLDFGAGSGPVITKVLKDNNYNICAYDPYFHNYPELLEQSYSYIACCEVIEHFYNPKREFGLLSSILNPDGKLYCMTDIYNDNIEFDKWYYKNDPTHVFIYQKKTFEFISRTYGFSNMIIDKRLVVLSKNAD